MRLNLTISAAVMGLCLSLVASGKALAETFSFTRIADTSQFSFTSSPTINDNGTVAFRSRNDLSASIFTGEGNQLNNIYGYDLLIAKRDTDNPPVINNTGTVTFDYILSYDITMRFLQETIFTAKDGNVSRIPYETNSFNSSLSSPVINDSSTIAFKPDYQNIDSIFANNGEQTTFLASNASNSLAGRLSDPAINNAGTVAFSGPITTVSNSGIFETLTGVFTTNISSGTDVTPIALKDDTFAGFGPSVIKQGTVGMNVQGTVAINDSGTVAFVARRSTEGSGIFTYSSDGLLNKIADTSDAFNSFGNVAINNQGTVAFAAGLNAGGQGIFIGADPVTNKVIATGDSLLGSTVTSLTFASRGLNNNQQIAFFATLANGESGIFRADQLEGQGRRHRVHGYRERKKDHSWNDDEVGGH